MTGINITDLDATMDGILDALELAGGFNIKFDLPASGVVIGDILEVGGVPVTILAGHLADGFVELTLPTFSEGANTIAWSLTHSGGGAAYLSGSDVISIDTIAPSIVSLVLDDPIITESDAGVTTVTLTITFSEQMDTSFITVTDNSAGTLVFASDGWGGPNDDVYTVTYTVADNNVELADIEFDVSGADFTGNTINVTNQSSGTSIDTIAPTVVVSMAGPDITLADLTDPIDVVLTFSEAMDPSVFPAIATNASGAVGAMAAVWSAGNTVLTLTYLGNDFGAPGQEFADITIDVSGAQDVAGNVMTAVVGQSVGVAVDMLRPTVTSIVRVASEDTNDDSISFTVTFSEDVSGVDTSDFTVTGSSATAVNVLGSGSVYTVVISGGDLAGFEGVVGLDFSGGQNITDVAGNALINTTPSGANETYTLDNTAPVIGTPVVEGVSGPDTIVNIAEAAGGVTVSVDVTGAPASVTIDGIAAMNTGGDTWEASLTAVDGTNNYDVVATDAVGNVDTQSFSYDADLVVPTISIGTIEGDDIVNATEEGDGIAISGTTTGVEDGQIAIINVDGTNYNATVTSNAWSITVPSGTLMDALAIAVTANVDDAAGNSAAGDTSSFDLNTGTPTISIDAIEGDNIVNATEEGDGIDISGTTTGVEDGQIAVINVDGTNYNATVTSNAWSINVASGTVADALAITVTASVDDAAGNSAAGDLSSFDLDTTADVGGDLAVSFDDGDALINATEMTATGVTIAGLDGDATGTLTITSAGGGTPVVVAGILADGSVSVDLSGLLDGALTATFDVTDAVGNTAQATGNSAALDQTSPTVSSITLNTPLINEGDDLGMVTVTVTYDSPMNVSGSFDPAISFTPALLSLASTGPGTWDVTGTIYSVDYDVADTDESFADVDITAAGGQDLAGNAHVSTTTTDVFTIDMVTPTVTGVVVSDTEISEADDGGAAFTVEVSYSEAMDTGTNPSIAFSVTPAGLTFTGGVWSAGGSVYTASYSVSDADETLIDLDITVTGAQDDVGGNPQDSFTESDAFTIDTDAPVLGSTSTVLDEYVEPNDGAASGDVLATFSNTDAGPGALTYTFAGGVLVEDGFELVDTGANTELRVFDPTLFDFEDDAAPSVDIIITDGFGNTTTTTFTVNLNDLDDAPEITAGGDITGTLVERTDTVPDAPSENDPTDFGDSGSIDFTDDDITDSHSVTVATISSSTGSFIGTFLAGLADPANGDGEGRVDWTFGNAPGAGGTPLTSGEMDTIDALADGETIVQVFSITITDFTGVPALSTTQNITVTITGTNDAPVISVGGGDSDSADIDETDGILAAGGTLTFSDVDTTDIVDIDSTSTGVVIDAASTFAGTNPLTTGDLQNMFSMDQTGVISNGSTSGSDNWVFNSGAATAFDFLAAGETLVLVYTVTATDDSGTGNATSTQEVTITITGTNDAAVIGAADLIGGVTEDATSPNLTDTGTIDFTDVDLNDTHSVSGITLDAASHGTQLGDLTASVSPDSMNGGTGTVTWNFSVADADVQFLAAGQSITETYTITLTDGTTGDDIQQTIVVTINGTNDAPSIGVVAGSDSASGGVTETDAANLTTAGTLTIADVDVIDVVSSSVTSVSVNAASTGTDGGISNGDLAMMMSVLGDLDGTETADVLAWAFDSNSTTFDYLANGETLVLDYVIEVDDGTATATQTVQVTITGTNDAPVANPGFVYIPGTTDLALIDEDSTHTGTLDPFTLSFLVQDVDGPLDSTSLEFTSVDVDGTTGYTLVEAGVAYNPANGDITFTPNTAIYQHLGVGDTLIGTIHYTVTDANGAQAFNTVTYSVEGTNDAPTITVDGGAGDSDAETIVETDAGLTTLGTLSVEDVDITDTVTVAVDSVIESGDTSGITNGTLLAMLGVDVGDIIDAASTTGTINWDFDSGAEAFDYLANGDTLTLTYTLTVTDTEGATDTIDVTVNITGTNDAPVANPGFVYIPGTTDLALIDEDSTHTGTLDPFTLSFLVQDVDGPLDSTSLEFTSVDVDGTTGYTLVEAGVAYNPANGDITFTPNTAIYQHLGVGDTLIGVIHYTVTDDFGDTAVSTVTYSVEGTNDLPTITVDGGAGDSAIGDVEENDAANLTDTGTLTIADVDVSDLVASSVASVSVSSGNDDGLLASGDLLNMMTVAGDLDGTETSEQITWTFNSLTTTFDYLAAGETLVLVYVIGVDDSLATATQTVVVTITGTNDQPVIAAGDTSALLEIAGDTAGTGTLSDFGTLALSDDDVMDTHTITDVLTSAVWADAGGTAIATPIPAALLTAIEIDAAFVADTGMTNNDIDWTFDLDDSEVDFLAAGETLTITYTITADDNGGFDGTGADEDSESASQTVVITITGTNDVPVITSTSPIADTEGNSIIVTDGIQEFDAPGVPSVPAVDIATVDLLNGTVDGTMGGTPITAIVDVDLSDEQSIDTVVITVNVGSTISHY